LPNFLKPVLALSISIIIFAGYIYLADADFLNFVQTRFYNPSVVNSYVKENALDAEIAVDHILELKENFSAVLREPAVLNSFLYNQTADDIFERSRIFGILLESIVGLLYVQFVDNNGMRIHYSTLNRDILNQSAGYTAYRNYNEDGISFPYDVLSVSAETGFKFTLDEQHDRIIFSFPFYDSMNIHRGTAFFYVSIRSFSERLIAEGSLKISDSISVIREPPGILLGIPEISRENIHRKVSEIWSEGIPDRVTFDSEDSEISFSLISLKTGSGLYFGRLIKDSMFSISEPMKLILHLSMFLTFFLTLFFLFNIKPNPVTLVRNRIKHLRDSLFEKLYVNKSGQERIRWILELEQRRDEIRKELKRKLKLNSRQEESINGIIDKSWDELLAVLKSGSGQALSEETIITMKKAEPLEEIGEPEELEEIDEAEAIDEVEPLEEIDEAEEIEEVEALEEIEEAEEIIEEAEALEEIEEAEEIIEEAEALEEIEEAEEIIEEAEALEEIEEAEEIIEEAEALEEIKEEVDKIAEMIEEEPVEEDNIIDTALKEALETDNSHKGLLRLAVDFIGINKKKEPVRKSKGLLELAQKKAPPIHRRGLLEHASQLNQAEPKQKKIATPPRGLLALASERESDDIFDSLDIVSPFTSMFSSLDDKEDNPA